MFNPNPYTPLPYSGFTKTGKPLGPDGKVLKKNMPPYSDPYWYSRQFNKNGQPLSPYDGKPLKFGKIPKYAKKSGTFYDPYDPNMHSYGWGQYCGFYGCGPAGTLPDYGPSGSFMNGVAKQPIGYQPPSAAGLYGRPLHTPRTYTNAALTGAPYEAAPSFAPSYFNAPPYSAVYPSVVPPTYVAPIVSSPFFTAPTVTAPLAPTYTFGSFPSFQNTAFPSFQSSIPAATYVNPLPATTFTTPTTTTFSTPTLAPTYTSPVSYSSFGSPSFIAPSFASF